MTEQEKKLFEGLREKGWFTGAEAPELLLSFDLSDRRIPPMIEKGKKPKKVKNPIGSSGGLILCQGYALIYRDRVVLWQEGVKIDEISLSESDRLTCDIAEGSVSMLLGEKVLFSARLKQKTAYYLLAKRFADLCEGKVLERESDSKKEAERSK